MSADLLREAAALMRQRAEVATPGPWHRESELHQDHGGADTYHHVTTDRVYVAQPDTDTDAEHIASWHPAVSLAVADWLDLVARLLGEGFDANAETTAALTVARAYLGRDS